jgi:hypothetical protein
MHNCFAFLRHVTTLRWSSFALALVFLLAGPPSHAQDIAELRNEGICNIGWAAGNAYGHPVWPQVKPHIGRGGTYYDAFVRLKAPGEDDYVAANMNLARYKECWERGERLPFNEAEGIARIQRAIDIVKEMTRILERMN